jgi:hypothetical protein
MTLSPIGLGAICRRIDIRKAIRTRRRPRAINQRIDRLHFDNILTEKYILFVINSGLYLNKRLRSYIFL